MVLLDVSHPPAGATTLIVSLGIISRPRELVIIEVAVFLLVAQALVINRLAGLPYPLWNAAASIKPVNEDSELAPIPSLGQSVLAAALPLARRSTGALKKCTQHNGLVAPFVTGRIDERYRAIRLFQFSELFS